MKKLVLGAFAAMLMTGTAQAEKIGVSIALLEHNFLAVMAKGMTDYAAKTPGLARRELKPLAQTNH